MTINLNNLTYSAYLADAAYIDFSKKDYVISGEITNTAKGDFLDRGFTESQFNYIQANYRIVDHLPNTATGLSVTIFETRDVYQDRTIAFRGTEFGPFTSLESAKSALQDLGRDLILAAGFDEFTGALGQNVAIRQFLIKNDILLADGTANPEYKGEVNITGHSLGGHLSLMTALNLPAIVKEVYTLQVPWVDNRYTRRFEGGGVARRHDEAARGRDRGDVAVRCWKSSSAGLSSHRQFCVAPCCINIERQHPTFEQLH